MTALSKVIVVISNELNISYAQAIRLERKLQAAGFCIAKQTWVEHAAAALDERDRINHERANIRADAERRAKFARPARTGDRRLPESVRVRRDGDGDSAAVGASVEDLRLGTDGGAP